MKRILTLSILAALLSSFIGCADRNDAELPYGPNGNVLAFITRTEVLGTAKDVEVIDGLAYVADEPYGISIWDVSVPSQPEFVELMELPGVETDASLIAIDPTGRVAALEATGDLYFYDLLNKHVIGPRGSGGHVEVELQYSNDTLYIYRGDIGATDGFNYEIFINTGTADSLSFNFLSPYFFSNYREEPYNLYGFGLAGSNLAYVARLERGVALIDYQSTAATLVTEYNSAGKVRDVDLTDNSVVCLAAGYEGLINIRYDAGHQELIELGSLRIQGATDIEQVIASGNKVFLLDDFDGIFAIDISDPSKPALIGDLEMSDPNRFCISGGFLYIADEDMGLVVAQITG